MSEREVVPGSILALLHRCCGEFGAAYEDKLDGTSSQHEVFLAEVY